MRNVLIITLLGCLLASCYKEKLVYVPVQDNKVVSIVSSWPDGRLPHGTCANIPKFWLFPSRTVSNAKTVSMLESGTLKAILPRKKRSAGRHNSIRYRNH